MFEQSGKVTSDKLGEEGFEERDLDVREELLERPEPFRAKFRSGTPHRSGPTSQHQEFGGSRRLTAASPPSSLAAGLEVEVTGLRPVKRNAPAFFRDRVSPQPGEPFDRGASQVVSASVVGPTQSSTASLSTGQSTSYPEVTVPHFTDEEFDDWSDNDAGPSISVPSRAANRAGGGVDRTRPLPPLPPARAPRERQNVPSERSRDRNEYREARNHQGRGTPRGGVRQGAGRDARADSRQPEFTKAGHDRRGERSTTRHHPRNDRAVQEQPRGSRTSRNSADLVDTTAERLFGEGRHSASRWSGRSRHEGSRHTPHRSQPYRPPARMGR